MWKTGKYCQLQCHEPVCCGEGADPCLSLHSRLLSLSRRLLSSFVSRRFDKRKATSTISLAAQTQSVSHVFNKSPFPPSNVVAGDLGVCCLHSNNCMGNDTTASRRQPNIIIVHETSESGVNIPASIPADIGGTKRARVFGLPRHAFDTSFTKLVSTFQGWMQLIGTSIIHYGCVMVSLRA